MSVTFHPAGRYDGPEVNVHNANGAALLDLLGYDPYDMCGVAPAEDFLGRVLLALALLGIATDDANGIPAVTDSRLGLGGITVEAQVVTGAREPGHLAMRLRELHDLAEWAKKHKSHVAWG